MMNEPKELSNEGVHENLEHGRDNCDCTFSIMPFLSRGSASDMPIKRSIIEKVVLDNFKSYGGRKVIGPFHKRLTSIVGPNGSGKSNVIDAMLFVFGKNARYLRFHNAAQLIHRSFAYEDQNSETVDRKKLKKSKTRSSIASCRVSVYFEDILDYNPSDDEYVVVAGSRVVIAREVNSEGVSKYFINGAVSSHKNVTELLSQKGIDLVHNRFLILQGEVELIAQLKPVKTKADEEGLLEYLEDIIGTNRYIEPLKDATAQAEDASAKFSEQLNRFKTTLNDLRALHKERIEAEEIIKNQSEQFSLILKKHFVQRLDIIGNYQEVAKEKQVLQNQLKCWEDEDLDLRKGLFAIEGKLSELKVSMDGCQKKMDQCVSQMKKFEVADDDCRMKIVHFGKKLKIFKDEMERGKLKIPKLKEKCEKHTEEMINQQSLIEKLEPELLKAREELDSLKEFFQGEMAAAGLQLVSAENDLAPLQLELDSITQDIGKLNTEQNLIENKYKRVDTTRQSLCETKLKCSETIKEQEIVLHTFSDKLNSSIKEFETKCKLLEDASRQYTETSHLAAEANKKYYELNSRLSNERDESRLDREMKKEITSGRLKGIHGRLCNLGSVDEPYVKAFNAAFKLGDCYITDTTQQAETIFNMARKNEWGRLTCLALEYMERETRESINDPFPFPEHERLIDKIKPIDPRYKCLFYHGLKNTVVVKTLNEAMVIGYDKQTPLRVVTINGELIEIDGRMSAGGSNKKK